MPNAPSQPSEGQQAIIWGAKEMKQESRCYLKDQQRPDQEDSAGDAPNGNQT
jgi:hypothetical protein